MLLAWSLPVAVGLAVVFAFIGHVFVDQRSDQPRVLRAEWPRTHRRALVPIERAEQSLIDALCPLFVELARVDGPVSRVEVRVTREFFEMHCKFGPSAMNAVRVSLKRALQHPVEELEAVVRAARRAVQPQARVEVMRWLYQLALVDGPLTRAETIALKSVARELNLSEEQLEPVTRRFLGQGEAHYQTLGLTPTATDDELRSAFRRLAAENHPDNNPSAQSAHRFHEIKEAYEALKQIRGL